MPTDNSLAPALTVIAVAVSIQTLVLLASVVAGVIAVRRWQGRLEHQYALVVARLDDTLVEAREAAMAVRRVTDQAVRSFDDVRRTVQHAAAFAVAPKNLWMAGATAAGALFARWRRQRQERG